MDFQRVFLFLIFSFSLFLLWDGWQKQNAPIQKVTTVSSTPVASSVLSKSETVKTPLTPDSSYQTDKTGEIVTIKTDVFNVEINTIGGDINRVELLKHFDTIDKNKPFVLFQRDAAHTYTAQTGLLGAGLPTHNSRYVTSIKDYQLENGKDTLVVRLNAQEAGNAKVAKIFTFHRSSYQIDIGYEILNTSTDRRTIISKQLEICRCSYTFSGCIEYFIADFNLITTTMKCKYFSYFCIPSFLRI